MVKDVPAKKEDAVKPTEPATKKEDLVKPAKPEKKEPILNSQKRSLTILNSQKRSLGFQKWF